jgi:hypothetical protein
MNARMALRWGAWTLVSLLVLALLVWLVSGVLERTTLSLDTAGREVSARTTVGNVSCQKTFAPTFPFVTLSCQEVEGASE